MTAKTLIERSYRLLGVKYPGFKAINDGLDALNEMVADWAADEIISLTVFYETGDTVDFPATYNRGLIYNLAVELISYAITNPDINISIPEQSSTVFKIARDTKETIRRLNYEPIKGVKIDSALSRNTRFRSGTGNF
jgi:hypothetical protein